MAECIGKAYLRNDTAEGSRDFDEGFLGGSGYIYEVFRVIDGIPLFLEDHLERLAQSGGLTGHGLPLHADDLKSRVYLLIHLNKLHTGNIKIVFIPGSGRDRAELLMYVIAHQYPSPQQFREGVRVVLFDGIRLNPNAKVMDVKLRQQTNLVKAEEDVYETLLVNRESCVTEGSRSNVFFIRGQEVVTPPLADVLPGITRKHVIDCCHREGIPVREEKMPVASLALVDAAFLSGTSRKVLPINRINDIRLQAAHPLTMTIQHAFNNRVTAYLLQAGLDMETKN